MLYTQMTKKALLLCFESHKEQRDKGGMPYVFHPFHLAEQMKDEDTITAALLHDVVEDTPCTLEDLLQMGFPAHVVEAVRLLTHIPHTPYKEYLEAIKENPIARQVKLADLHHNSDITRLETLQERDHKRLQRYADAIRFLEE